MRVNFLLKVILVFIFQIQDQVKTFIILQLASGEEIV